VIGRSDDGFEVRWRSGPVVIDGRLDDAAWEHAQTIDHFTLPWLQENERPSRTATRARLLWDRGYLYFAADLEDHDLYADIAEHDGPTWDNDVFEIFFRPARDKGGYFELQVNPLNTHFDAFFRDRNPEEAAARIGEHLFRFESAVMLNGTLDNRDDVDEGWIVEGRIPWSDFLPAGGRPNPGEEWTFALCRYDYSHEWDEPELSTCAPLKSKDVADFHLIEDYAPLRFIGPADSPGVAPFGISEYTPVTTSRVFGSPDPPLPYRAVRVAEDFSPNWPVDITTEPGSRRLVFIDEERPYARSRIGRTAGFPETGEIETLFETEDVAYSIEFHPNFAENGYMYVGSKGLDPEGGPKRCRITRYTISREPPFALDQESAVVIIDWVSDGHDGTAITFGHDGMMYVTTGDGTSDSDTNVVGQTLDHLLAKVLRIDVDHPDEGRNYSVPADNPWVNEPGIVPEAWAYGLRNPWRMTTDPANGRIWVAQNGQDLFEQVYVVNKGDNYGWSVYEGSHPFYLERELGPHPHVLPTFEHPHSEARSLTGGVVYHGTKLPDLKGAYIYSDYSTGKIWGGLLDDAGEVSWHRELVDTPFAITAIDLDPDGELLITDHQGDGKGAIYTLEPNTVEHDGPEFPRTLSASGLFASVVGHVPAEGAIPYTVNSPLWSDGTYKERFVALPQFDETGNPRATITFHPRNSWTFPNGTVFVKSFAMEKVAGDPASRRWIETRFLHRQQNEWVGYSYQWNDEETDAVLVASAGADVTFDIKTTDGIESRPWRYPSRTECMVCHSRAANFVLGLSTPQLHCEFAYDQAPDNQLRVFEHLGVFDNDWQADAIADLREDLAAEGKTVEEIDAIVNTSTNNGDQRQAPRSSLLSKELSEYETLADPYDETLDLDLRARSYLHANCAHCHVEAGGGNSQINLAFWVANEDTKMIDVVPVHHRFELDDARLVAPGRPESSVLLHRLSIRERGQMPQLATFRHDERAVALIREWIATMAAKNEDDAGD
jgi:uncharacterized repeat protein (TIGR03806 family)